MPITINNYSFTPVTYDVPEAHGISEEVGVATLTIIPNEGYTATASSFSLDASFSNQYVSTVTFAQSGLNVICSVTFLPGVIMPSSNVTIPLCIVGEGNINALPISGTFTANVEAGIIGNGTETDTPYSASGLEGTQVSLFTRSYSAPAGMFISYQTPQITVGNQSNYTFPTTQTFDALGNLIAISYDFKYLFPGVGVSGDKLFIKGINVYALRLPQPSEVTGYSTLPVFVNSAGTAFPWNVFGVDGASFSASMTDGVDTVTIATNVIIGTGGVSSQLIDFPTYSGAAYRDWVLTLTGDLQSPFLQTNPATIRQYALNTTTLTASSANGIVGFTPVLSSLPALQQYATPMVYPVSWNLSVPAGTIISERTPTLFDVTEVISVFAQATTAQSNVSSLDITNLEVLYGPLQVGDRFNINAPSSTFGQAPFAYTVTAINSATNISVSPNITVAALDTLRFYRTNGTAFSLTNATFTQVDNQNITLDFNLETSATGDVSTTLTLDLDNIITFAPAVSCSATIPSGGVGVTDNSVALDPAGGIVCFLVDPIGVPDKFEIIHGNANGTKVATSGMNTTGNSGPFDNTFGTEPTNVVPSVIEATNTLQFIGTDKDPVDTRQTEFNTATGETIATMQPGGTGVTYKQVLWWEYTAADYVTNSSATFRVTGPTGTGWNALRVCFP
tara:strand:+ start:928 stop:2955 length:2028 start_codon:yes stop_codon:yes gene_type:complete